MSDWNTYIKQMVTNGNKVVIKKVKKSELIKEEDNSESL